MNLPVVNMKQTGQNITMLREQRGLSVKQLQRMMGFTTPQAIYKWQHGESLPTVDNLACLSRLYGVPMEALLYGDEGAEPVQQETKEEAVPETEETVQGTPERPAGTAPGKQKGSGTSRRKAAALVLAAVCALLVCAGAYLASSRGTDNEIHSMEEMEERQIDISAAGSFDTTW